MLNWVKSNDFKGHSIEFIWFSSTSNHSVSPCAMSIWITAWFHCKITVIRQKSFVLICSDLFLKYMTAQPAILLFFPIVLLLFTVKVCIMTELCLRQCHKKIWSFIQQSTRNSKCLHTWETWTRYSEKYIYIKYLHNCCALVCKDTWSNLSDLLFIITWRLILTICVSLSLCMTIILDI